MSELTTCNYCTLERIKEHHGADKVTARRMTHHEDAELLGPVRNSAYETRTWYRVDVEGIERPVAYFMELTAGCVCG